MLYAVYIMHNTQAWFFLNGKLYIATGVKYLSRTQLGHHALGVFVTYDRYPGPSVQIQFTNQ